MFRLVAAQSGHGSPLLAALVLLLVASAAAAQAPPSASGGAPTPQTDLALPDDLPADAVEAFVAPLTDAQARALLITAMKEAAPLENVGMARTGSLTAQLLGRLRSASEGLAAGVRAHLAALPALGEEFADAFLLVTDFGGWAAMVSGLAAIAAMSALGAAAARPLRRAAEARRAEANAALDPDAPFAARASAAAWHFGGRLAATLVFVAVAFMVSFVFFGPVEPMRLLAATIVFSMVGAYVARSLARTLFAPKAPHLRLVAFDDREAAIAARFTTAALSLVVLIGFLTGLGQLLGFSAEARAWLTALGGALGFALAARAALAWLDPTAPRRATPRPWPGPLGQIAQRCRDQTEARPRLYALAWLALTALGFLVALLAYRAGAAGSAALLAAAPFLFAVIARVGAPRPRAHFLREVARFALATLTLAAALDVMGLPLSAAFFGPQGEALRAALSAASAVLAVAAAAWIGIGLWAGNLQAREHEKALAIALAEGIDQEDPESGQSPAQTRLGTLAPLFRVIGQAFVALMAFLAFFSALGVDIAPLLAGAGVVGLAVGFGAQALVRDVVAGLFFLIDDAFRVGEYVEMGELRGEVERISIRSMRLRHHRGAVHTVPFGELRSITNYNRDWAIYKQEFRVPFDTDLERLRKAVKRLGRELLADPENGSKFLQPLKSQGVRAIDDSALIVGTKFMCKPREQFVLRRIVYARMQALLAELGVPLATRRVTVENAGGGDAGAVLPDPAAALDAAKG